MKRITLIFFTFAFALIVMAQQSSRTIPPTSQVAEQPTASNEWLAEARKFCQDLVAKSTREKNPSETLKKRAKEAEAILKLHNDGASLQELTEKYEILYLTLVGDMLKSPLSKSGKDNAYNLLDRVNFRNDRDNFRYFLDNYDRWLLEIAHICWQAEDDHATSSMRPAWKRQNESRAYIFTQKLDSCNYNFRKLPILTDNLIRIPYFDGLIDKAKERMLVYRNEQSTPLSFDDILPAEPKRDRRILQFEVNPRNTHATVKVKGQNDADYEPWGEINSDGRVERFLDFGTYYYVVSAKDYNEYEESVTVTKGKDVQIVHVSLKRKPVSDDTSKKLHKFCEVMHKYGSYLQPTFQVGRTTAAGFAVGGYINKINIEAGGLFGIGTQEVYWESSKGYFPRFEKLQSSAFSLRAGYGVASIESLRFTPQLGLNHIRIKGDISKSFATALSLGCRADYKFTKHIGVILTPEYAFAIKKSDTYKRLVDGDIRNFATGFNFKLGVLIIL